MKKSMSCLIMSGLIVLLSLQTRDVLAKSQKINWQINRAVVQTCNMKKENNYKKILIDNNHYINIESENLIKYKIKSLQFASVLIIGLVLIDIKIHKKSKNKGEIKIPVKSENELLQMIVDAIPDPVLYHTIEGTYIKSNVAFNEFYGVDSERLSGTRVYHYYPKELIREIKNEYGQIKPNNKIIRCEGEIQGKSGKIRSVLLSRNIVMDENDNVKGLISIATDITERKLIEEELVISKEKLEKVNVILNATNEDLARANEKLEKLSILDALTNIPNRRYFDNVFYREWQRSIRMKSKLAMLIVDVDYFKEYNDNYGHIEGDLCLIEVANAIQDSLKRTIDFVARYGGDEFIVILPETDENGACNVSNRILETLNEKQLDHNYAKNEVKKVTVSIGVALVQPDLENDSVELIKHADRALYEAKKSGRNQYKLNKNKV